MTETTRAKRNMSLEWLRICSMLMIILLHSIDHSGVLENLKAGSALYYAEWFLYAAVQVCVNCFVLISGYFLVTARFKPAKLVLLWMEVVFYSVVIKVILMATGQIPVSIASLVSCLIPVFTGRYWYVTIYFGMYLLSPFLNVGIRALSKRQHAALLLVLFVLFCGMISVYPSFKGMNSGGGWGLAWFVVLYITAAYFRLHYQPTGRKAKPLVIFCLCPILMLAALAVSQKLGIARLSAAVENLWRYDSVPAAIASAALFVTFLNCRQRTTRFGALISTASATTFGVYLIHAHANLCTQEMWQRIGMLRNMDWWWFVLYQLGIVLAIFVACALLDWLRKTIVEKTKLHAAIEKLVSRLWTKYVRREERV